MVRPTLNQIIRQMNKAGKIPYDSLGKRNTKVLTDMMICHTPEAGFTKEICPNCGTVHEHYGSCNNVNCPQCGVLRRERWYRQAGQKMVNAKYFHIVFTVPDAPLADLFRQDEKEMYQLLFESQSKALKELSSERMKAETVGYFSVLHSWGSTMSYHPHIHTVFCGAGLDKDGELVRVKGSFLFPAKVLANRFKKHFMKGLKAKYEKSNSPWLDNIRRAQDADWNVEIRPPLDNPASAVKYLSRYVNRTAISNQRIVSYENGMVTFTYKDYRKKGKIREMTLEDKEFLRRFLQHIPPARFSRSRFYGFMSNNSKKQLETMIALAGEPAHKPTVPETNRELLEEVTGRRYGFCSACGHRSEIIEVKRDLRCLRIINNRLSKVRDREIIVIG